MIWPMSDPHDPNAHMLAKRVAEEVTPEVSKFIGTVVGSTQIEISDLLAEEIRSFRFKRQIRHVTKAMDQLDKAGLEAGKVPLRTLAPLLEAASLEEDEGLSDRWASLLANAASGATEVPASFPYVLRELEPKHATVLDELYSLSMQMAPELRRRHGLNGPRSAEIHGLTVPEFHFLVDNLVRLRLAEAPSDKWDEVLVLTEFGRAFVRACRPLNYIDPAIRWTSHAELIALSSENRKARAEAAQRREEGSAQPAAQGP
jgi:hypothetical protein